MLRIEGERVLLRDWVAADLSSYRHWLRPEHEWHRWDAPYYGVPATSDADAVVARLAGQVGAADWPSPRTRLVIADPEEDRYLGLVSWYWESEPSDWRRVGIVLHDPATWSGGRGTEALALWTSYLFDSTVRGRRYDSVVYGVLRTDWRSR